MTKLEFLNNQILRSEEKIKLCKGLIVCMDKEIADYTKEESIIAGETLFFKKQYANEFLEKNIRENLLNKIILLNAYNNIVVEKKEKLMTNREKRLNILNIIETDYQRYQDNYFIEQDLYKQKIGSMKLINVNKLTKVNTYKPVYVKSNIVVRKV